VAMVAKAAITLEVDDIRRDVAVDEVAWVLDDLAGRGAGEPRGGLFEDPVRQLDVGSRAPGIVAGQKGQGTETRDDPGVDDDAEAPIVFTPGVCLRHSRVGQGEE